MSGLSFKGLVEAHNLLAGNSASHGGTFNVNFYCSDVKSDGNEKDTDFTLTADLSQVTEVAHFVAREEELTQMRETLRNAPTRRTAIVHGLGGMGKTQLTKEYIKRNCTDYSAIIWLNAKDEVSLKESFARAARSIVLQYPSLIYMKDTEESPDLDRLVHAVNRWLSEPKNNKWLVIYDNYDFPKLDDGRDESESTDETSRGIMDETNPTESDIVAPKAFDIRPFFPATLHGAIIVTTRSSTVELGRLIHLRKFRDIKDSLEILATTSRRQDAHNNSAAAQLALKLDGLPLALSTAGAYLKGIAMSWEEYFKLYQDSWLRLQKTSPRLLTYESRAMYSTWNISYAHIKQQNRSAAMLLELWAYFDNEDLWYELLRQGGSDTEGWLEELTRDQLCFNEVMRVLCSHGLVEPDSRGGYSVHGCIHSWIVFALNPKMNAGMAWLATRCVASSVQDNTELEYWLMQRRLLQHAGQCFRTIATGLELQEGDEWMLHQFGVLFQDQGRLGDAEAMYNRALRGKEKALGPEHTSTLDTVNNLANLYAEQGQLGDAEAMYNRALRGYEKALGPEHTSTLDTVNNLGLLYAEQGRLGDAEAMYNRALRGCEKALGPEHTSTLDTVNNLANLYADQGRLGDAEAMYDRALRGYEKALGPEHTSTLDTVNNLGLLYAEQGQLGDAEAMYDRALRGCEKALGPEHISTLTTVNNLGLLYANQGQLGDAEAMYDRALRGYEKALGISIVETYSPALNTMENLGDLFCTLNRLEEARLYYTRAEAGLRTVYGSQSEKYQRVISKLQTQTKLPREIKPASSSHKRFPLRKLSDVTNRFL